MGIPEYGNPRRRLSWVLQEEKHPQPAILDEGMRRHRGTLALLAFQRRQQVAGHGCREVEATRTNARGSCSAQRGVQ